MKFETMRKDFETKFPVYEDNEWNEELQRYVTTARCDHADAEAESQNTVFEGWIAACYYYNIIT